MARVSSGMLEKLTIGEEAKGERLWRAQSHIITQIRICGPGKAQTVLASSEEMSCHPGIN